jgi:hypothetical protein
MESQERQLRITHRFQEIHNLIFNSLEAAGSLLWKSTGDLREKHPVVLKSISPGQDTLTLQFQIAGIAFSPNEIVYLRLASRSSAIKTRILQVSEAALVVEFPTQAAFEEGRKLPRSCFHPSESRTALIRVPMDRVRGHAGWSHSALVSDVSTGGIGIFIPATLKGQIGPKTKISLLSLGLQKFPKPPHGEAMFCIPTTLRSGAFDRTGYRVGIHFPRGIDSEAVEQFVAKRNLFSVTEEQIVRDEKFRRAVVEKMGGLRKTLAQSPLLGEWIARFAPDRSGNFYLQQHVHLLCQVLAGLGTRLGWISERSIDKLIYVAYLHDIRFSKLPHLARIGSLAALEESKTPVSPEDKAAFLEAPAYAAEIARRDLEAYPDAITMLLQQKELPDGSGHPHGLTASQIAPLSALFIVAHCFVDYVIDHPDWSPHDFVRTYHSRFKGQYFKKIFDILAEA